LIESAKDKDKRVAFAELISALDSELNAMDSSSSPPVPPSPRPLPESDEMERPCEFIGINAEMHPDENGRR